MSGEVHGREQLLTAAALPNGGQNLMPDYFQQNLDSVPARWGYFGLRIGVEPPERNLRFGHLRDTDNGMFFRSPDWLRDIFSGILFLSRATKWAKCFSELDRDIWQMTTSV